MAGGEIGVARLRCTHAKQKPRLLPGRMPINMRTEYPEGTFTASSQIE